MPDVQVTPRWDVGYGYVVLGGPWDPIFCQSDIRFGDREVSDGARGRGEGVGMREQPTEVVDETNVGKTQAEF